MSPSNQIMFHDRERKRFRAIRLIELIGLIRVTRATFHTLDFNGPTSGYQFILG